jgi:hypothetical protein
MDERFCDRAGRYFMKGDGGSVTGLAVTRGHRAVTLVKGETYINARSRFGNEFIRTPRQFDKILMKSKPEPDAPPGSEAMNALRSWVMTALTAVFVLLYGAALLGWLRPLPDERAVARLEPIIFVIIGYYFGRLPAQQNEQTLKGELSRQAQKADAAQHAKEQAQQGREALEEKLKNVRVTLASSASSAIGAAARELVADADETAAPTQFGALRQRVAVALGILKS